MQHGAVVNRSMNVMIKRMLRITVIVFLFQSLANSQVTLEDAIDLLGQVPASSLDSLLPKTAFLHWFKNTVGPDAKLQWEINDCGEQTGVPSVDQQRDIPVCLEVTALLPDRRTVGVAINVGTEKKGLIGDPSVFNIYIQGSGPIQHVRRLRDLPRALFPDRNK
jgi:hypothetical protein